MVHAGDDLVVVALIAESGKEVISCWRIELRSRIDVVDGFGERGYEIGWNPVVEKRISDHPRAGGVRSRTRRVEYGPVVPKTRTAEIAAPLLLGRHVGLARLASANPGAFVAGEEERAVADDRPAQSPAEQVVPQGRLLLAEEIGEEIGGIESVVPEKLVPRAMEGVAAGLGGGIHLGRKPPKFRRVGVHLQLEFLHGIHGRKHGGSHVVGVYRFHAVHQVAVGVVSSPPCRKHRRTQTSGHGPLAAGVGVRRSRSRARRQNGQIKHRPPFQRQILDLVRLDHLAHRARFRGDQRNRPGYLYRVRHRADL